MKRRICEEKNLLNNLFGFNFLCALEMIFAVLFIMASIFISAFEYSFKHCCGLNVNLAAFSKDLSHAESVAEMFLHATLYDCCCDL